MSLQGVTKSHDPPHITDASHSKPFVSHAVDDASKPVPPPMCVGVIGYTPQGLSENVVWAADAGLMAYAGACGFSRHSFNLYEYIVNLC